MGIQQILDYYSDKRKEKLSDKMKKYQIDYREENKGSNKRIIKIKNKEYYQKNKEIIKAYQKAYRISKANIVKT